MTVRIVEIRAASAANGHISTISYVAFGLFRVCANEQYRDISQTGHDGIGLGVGERLGLVRLVGVSDYRNAGRSGAMNIPERVTDEYAVAGLCADVEYGAEHRFGVRFHAAGVGVGPADNRCDVARQPLRGEVLDDRSGRVVADDGFRF